MPSQWLERRTSSPCALAMAMTFYIVADGGLTATRSPGRLQSFLILALSASHSLLDAPAPRRAGICPPARRSSAGQTHKGEARPWPVFLLGGEVGNRGQP